MSEPTLESIEDYDELKGNKKKIVWTVIIAGLIIGTIYSVVYMTDTNDDAIEVEKNFKSIPMK